MIMSIEKLYGDVLDIIETARNKLYRIANVSIVRSYLESPRAAWRIAPQPGSRMFTLMG
jgi:hypothetical protein